MNTNRLLKDLGVRYPIVLAPMGGAGTVAMAAAVTNAGGFGFLPAQYLSANQIREWTARLRNEVTGPFGINLFAPSEIPPVPADPSRALEILGDFHRELGIPAPETPGPFVDSFEDKFEACLESGAAVFSFTFGIPPTEVISEIKARGMLFVGTATSVREAELVEEAGGDAVVAQGSEAGAHRGTFAVGFEEAMIGTAALVPQVVDRVSIPVLASGGIMDGRGIAAALALGASAVQMGTAFLPCEESAIPQVHKDAILSASETQTVVTTAFSGRPARGLRNRVTETLERHSEAILPYPYQNSFTRPMRSAAASMNETDYLSLWAGQGVRMARRSTAADLVEKLVRETSEVIESMRSFLPGR